jgi:hypothetical protein
VSLDFSAADWDALLSAMAVALFAAGRGERPAQAHFLALLEEAKAPADAFLAHSADFLPRLAANADRPVLASDARVPLLAYLRQIAEASPAHARALVDRGAARLIVDGPFEAWNDAIPQALGVALALARWDQVLGDVLTDRFAEAVIECLAENGVEVMEAALAFVYRILASSAHEGALAWVARNARPIADAMAIVAQTERTQTVAETVEIVRIVCERADAGAPAHRAVAEAFMAGGGREALERVAMEGDPAVRAAARAVVDPPDKAALRSW